MIGLSTAIAIENAAYQYLKTGKGPEGVKDLIVPQTGGQTPEGAPERALLPGFEKDFLGWWHDPPTEFGGKLSPLVRLGKDLATGKDYFDHDIAPFARWTPDWFKAYGNHIMKSATPIPLKAEVLKGSNMPMAERVMGNRPAPEYLQNPGRIADIEHANRVKDLKGQLRGLYTHGRRTTEERKALDDKAKEIIKQLQREHAAWSRERKERKPLKHSSGAE